MQEQVQRYLTVPEVADHYRTSEGTVRYWRHVGYGPNGVKVGTRVLYPASEIDRFDRELAAQAGMSSPGPVRGRPGGRAPAHGRGRGIGAAERAAAPSGDAA